MYCGNCGTEISSNSNFCPKCGNAILNQHNVVSNNKNDLLRQKIYKNKTLLMIAAILCVVFSIVIIAVVFIIFNNEEISDNGYYDIRDYFLNMGLMTVPFIIVNAILLVKFLKTNKILEEVIRIIDFNFDYNELDKLFNSIRMKSIYLIIPILLCGSIIAIPIYIVQIIAIISTKELIKYYEQYRNKNNLQ